VADGVPESVPVAVLNEAHEGRFAIEKLSGEDSGSEAAGVKV
jgi:hypothetical protein